MMKAMGDWILSVAAASVCIAAVCALIPKGTVRAVANVSSGLILLAVMLRPLAYWDVASMSLRYGEYYDAVQQQIEVYADGYQQQLESRIQQDTAAYISEKAAQWGLHCQPTVTTELTEGVPVPAEVTLDIAEDATLRDWITHELGIPPSQQHWKETP